MSQTRFESIVRASAWEKVLSLWPTGVILAAVFAVTCADYSVPRVLPYGALCAFAATMVIYALQHRNVLARFWVPSAVTLAFVTLLFRGLPIRALDLVRWLPLSLSASLLTAVHTAPIIVRIMEDPRSAPPLSLVSSLSGTRRLPVYDLESQGLLSNVTDGPDLSPDGSPSLGPIGNPDRGTIGGPDLDPIGGPNLDPDGPDDGSSIDLNSEGGLTRSSIRLLIDTIENGATGLHSQSRSTLPARAVCAERPALPHAWPSQYDRGHMRIPPHGVLPGQGAGPVSVDPEVGMGVNSGEPPDTAAQVGLLGHGL